MYLRQSCSHRERWIKPRVTAVTCTCTNICTWDFPDVIKFRVAAHTTAEKAIRFRHPDYNPDRAQKFSSSMSPSTGTWTRHRHRHRHRHATFHSNPCTRFWVILLTDRQTDRQTNERGQKHNYTSSFVGDKWLTFLCSLDGRLVTIIALLWLHVTVTSHPPNRARFFTASEVTTCGGIEICISLLLTNHLFLSI